MIRITTALALTSLLLPPLAAQQEPAAPTPPAKAGKTQSHQDVAALIQQLGSDTFKQRLDAERALRAIGKDALPALRDAAANDQQAEAQWRAKRLIRQIERGETGGLDKRTRDNADNADNNDVTRRRTPVWGSFGFDPDMQGRFDRLFGDLERDFGIDVPRGRFFNDGFFRDLQQQMQEMRDNVQKWQGGAMGHGQSMSMQVGPDGVRVEIKQKDKDGKEDAKVYEAPDLETFKQKYPGVLEQHGLGLGFGPMRMFFDDGQNGALIPQWQGNWQFGQPLRGLRLRTDGQKADAGDHDADQPMVEVAVPPAGKRLGVVIKPQIAPEVRDYLGLEEGEGLQVAEVQDGTLAQKLGVEVGDIVVRIGGNKIGATQDVQSALGAIEPGHKVEVVVLRRGKERTLTADKPSAK